MSSRLRGEIVRCPSWFCDFSSCPIAIFTAFVYLSRQCKQVSCGRPVGCRGLILPGRSMVIFFFKMLIFREGCLTLGWKEIKFSYKSTNLRNYLMDCGHNARAQGLFRPITREIHTLCMTMAWMMDLLWTVWYIM